MDWKKLSFYPDWIGSQTRFGLKPVNSILETVGNTLYIIVGTWKLPFPTLQNGGVSGVSFCPNTFATIVALYGRALWDDSAAFRKSWNNIFVFFFLVIWQNKIDILSLKIKIFYEHRNRRKKRLFNNKHKKTKFYSGNVYTVDEATKLVNSLFKLLA